MGVENLAQKLPGALTIPTAQTPLGHPVVDSGASSQAESGSVSAVDVKNAIAWVSRLCETMSARRLSGDHRTIESVTELDPLAAIVVADHQLQIVRGLVRTSRCITSDVSRASLLVLIDAAVSTLEAPWSDLEPEARAVVDIRGGQA